MEKRRWSSCVLFWLVLSTGAPSGRGCPAPDITLEEILEGNPHLRNVYEELEPQGFFTPEGLRSLLVRLMLRTACPSKAETEHAPHHDHDHEHHDHSHHAHENPLGDNHDHGDHDHDHADEDNHDHAGDNHDHADDNHDHGDHEHHDETEKLLQPDHGGEDHHRTHTHEDKLRESLVQPGRVEEREDTTSSPLQEGEGHRHEEDVSKIPEKDAVFGTQDCDPVEDVISSAHFEEGSSVLLPGDFLQLCPSILNSLLSPHCQDEGKKGNGMDALPSVDLETHSSECHGYDHKDHNHHHHTKGDNTKMTRDAWIAAIVSMIIIGLVALMCIMIIPVLKKSKYYVFINHFLLALAVGSLAGDALIHLLPHAMTMEIQLGMSAHLVHALYGFTAFVGILLFLLMERLHNLIGHKHSHGHGHGHGGHSHETPVNADGDELVKEIGIISAELNEGPSPHLDKIGEKLSQHSKHSSFIFADSNSPSDATRGCFESCPPNLGSGPEDANGNNGNVDSMLPPCKPRQVDHNSASVAECERLVNSQPPQKNEQISSSKTPLTPIPPPPLVQNSPPKSLVRQDSKNFNMVLQEYHVGHHGHSHHGHSHVTGKKDSLRTMILLGDGMHTLMDGMAIGAAYGTSLTGGIATAIAVLCHELPHKVGDFAILFEMGMRRKQAVKMVLILWVLSLIGLAVGVSIGSIKEISPWIYCFTAGVFLYLALVDLLSELSINDTESCSAANQMALQVAGLLTGAGIMLVIAVYEHDLEYLLEGAF